MADEVEKSWYTKYRPRTLEEYSGPVIKGIIEKRFTKRENMPHVIMIQGNRGCGKTTLARILSKYYLCMKPNEDGTPCEECEMCTSINDILIDGKSTEMECPGVTEVDATIMNGKDAIQEILDDAIQPPLYSQYKILIIDETHMVSQAAQNSMLKILEDIVPHLVVIFATTNPEKVLQTIRSRCQLTLEARKQTVEDMSNRLMQIAEMERLTGSKEAVEIIAKKGDRVPRECINILENVAKTYNNEVTTANVRDYIGGIASDMYMKYFKCANKSLSEILQFVRNLRIEDIKIDDFVKGLTGFVLDSMYIKHGIALEEYPVDYVKSVKNLFDMYDSSDFDMLLQLVEYLSNQITNDDTNKNEMLLVTTAMRISKIDLLANGLANEQKEAIAENRISLVEHHKMLKANNEEALEASKMDMDIREIKEEFGDVHQVANTANMLEQLQMDLPGMIKLDSSEEDDAEGDEGLGLDTELEEFLNN